jgi:hypothetical protein
MIRFGTDKENHLYVLIFNYWYIYIYIHTHTREYVEYPYKTQYY